jgi:hypothetical protein
MEGESRKGAVTPPAAVFLSYASEDTEAAERIAMALRTAGIEVWFDKSALRGGETWDRSIREQINECVLFIPIISANAHARIEGYFRLEWKLAIDRSHRIAPDQAFLLPVVIDDTRQADKRIPDRFRELQWACLPGGHVSAVFTERVRQLLSSEAAPERAMGSSVSSGSATAQAASRPTALRWAPKPALWSVSSALALAVAYLVVDKLWVSKRLALTSASAVHETVPRTNSAAPAAAAFNPPPHSIACCHL